MEMEEKLDGFHLKNHYKDHILQFYDEVNGNGNANVLEFVNSNVIQLDKT
jgi:hypothetical protein